MGPCIQFQQLDQLEVTNVQKYLSPHAFFSHKVTGLGCAVFQFTLIPRLVFLFVFWHNFSFSLQAMYNEQIGFSLPSSFALFKDLNKECC